MIKLIAMMVVMVFALNVQAGAFPFNCDKLISEHACAPIIGKWTVQTADTMFKVGGVVEYHLDGTTSFNMTGRTLGVDPITVSLKGKGVWMRKGAALASSMTEKQSNKMEVVVTGTDKDMPEELMVEVRRDIQKIALEIILTPRGDTRKVQDHPRSHVLEEGELPSVTKWRRYRG